MFAEVNGVSVRYEVSGEGEPVLLLCGYGTTHAYWDQMLGLLDGYLVVTMDNRGSGETRHDGPFTLEDMAEDAAALMEHLGIGRYHLLGWSLGSHIAQCLALRHGDRLKSLTLVATYTRRPARAAYVLNGYTRMCAEGRAPMECLAMAVNAMSLPPSLFEKMEAHGRTVSSEPWPEDPEGLMMQMEAVNACDNTERVRGISVPTLLVHGREDMMVPCEVAVDVAGRIPGSRLVLLDDAGHSIPASRYAALFREFAESHRRREYCSRSGTSHPGVLPLGNEDEQEQRPAPLIFFFSNDASSLGNLDYREPPWHPPEIAWAATTRERARHPAYPTP